MQPQMETQAVKAGNYQFAKGYRKEAATLAFTLSLNEQQVAGKTRLRYMRAALQAIKSFCHRTVSLSPAMVDNDFPPPPHIELIKHFQDKYICQRKISLHEVPEGWSWKHGKAKGLSRHVVVRHWTIPGKTHSSRHTALSIEDKEKGRKDYVTRVGIIYSGKNSWRNSTNFVKRSIGNIIFKIAGSLSRFKPMAVSSYNEDKNNFIGMKALFNLAEAEEAQDLINKGEVSKELLQKAKYSPLSFQKKSAKTGLWQRRAEKVYLPCMGTNKVQATGQQTFTMFGLNLENMQQAWQKMQYEGNPYHYYRQLSTTQNCSGMSLEILRAGGAESFCSVTKRLYVTPDQVDQYSRQLMERLESLNNKADKLLQKCEETETISCDFMPCIERLSANKQHLPHRIKSCINDICRVASSFIEHDEQQFNYGRLNEMRTSEALTPMAVTFVEAVDKAFEVAGNNEEALNALAPALSLYMQVRTLMQQSCV